MTSLYNPNVPQNRSDGLDTTQPELLQNFDTIFTAFRNNHKSINTASNGEHTIVQLIELSQSPQTEPGEINIYCKRDADTTDQLFMRCQGNGQEIQLTCYQIYHLTPVNNGLITIHPYFTFLPGRVMVYFGTFRVNNGLPGSTLNLYPSIAKNIITVSATVSSDTPLEKPRVGIPAKVGGFYRSIEFVSKNLVTPLPPLNYIILANV